MTEHARLNSETAAPAEASAAASGGPAKGREEKMMADQAAVVKAAAQLFRPHLGEILTRDLAGQIAVLAWLDYPKLTFGELVELIYPRILRGALITPALADERARQIAIAVTV